MKKIPALALAAWFASALAASAQPELPGSPAGVNAALVKLFGDARAFSAQADVRVLDKSRQETIATPMDFALLDGKIRVAVDISRVKNKDLPAAAVERMKQLGLDHVVSIIRPDQKTSHVIFPGAQAYMTAPLPKEDQDTYTKDPRLQKTALGKETLDGHPCVKNEETLTDSQGRRRKFTVWRAGDMKDFPVQIQTQENDDTVILRYRQVRLSRPDAKDFEPPAGFRAYHDMPSLMQAVMMKVINGGGASPR